MKQQLTAVVGVLFMILLVVGVLLPAGSFEQRIFFMIGAPALYCVAAIQKEVLFMALQGVVTVGAAIAFIPQTLDLILLRCVIMLVVAVAAIVWLNGEKTFKGWKKEWLGALGLLLIAFGLATPMIYLLWLFFALLGLGGVLVAVHSAISWYRGFRLGWIWLILNSVFAYNPIVQFWQLIRM